MIWLFPLLALPVVDPDQIVRTQPSKAVNRKLGFVARPDAHGSRTRYLDWSTKVCLELNPPLLLVWYSSLRLRPGGAGSVSSVFVPPRSPKKETRNIA